MLVPVLVWNSLEAKETNSSDVGENGGGGGDDDGSERDGGLGDRYDKTVMLMLMEMMKVAVIW